MNCNEAAEFVSALYDGERIPREIAEHLGRCARCKALMADFAAMGAELRLAASLDSAREMVVPRGSKPQWTLAGWWQKGWQMMRIPRFAFALLLVGIAVLGSSFALVEVRAHSEGAVVKLEIDPGTGQPIACALSTVDKTNSVCAAMMEVKGSILSYQIKLLHKEGSRVQLGVRSRIEAAGPGAYTLSALDSLSEDRYWFEPGQVLKIPVSGLGNLTVSGEWMDHMPTLLNTNQSLDPALSELRMTSPILLRNGQVVGDMEGGIAYVDKPGWGVQIYMPAVGRFQISLQPVAGAVAARVQLNRLSFESDGQAYAFITGTPIARAHTVWVLQDASFKPEGDASAHGFIGSTAITQTAGPNATP